MGTAAKPLPEWKRFRFPRSLLPVGVLLASAAFVAWALEVLRIDLERLPGLFGRIADVLSRRYWPPD